MSFVARAFALTSLVALIVAAALHLLVLGGVARVWSPMVHLALFGSFTAIILAVNYHTMPVFAARTFPYPRLLVAHWYLFAAGIALTTIGQLGRWPGSVSVGLTLQLLAALLFLANTVALFVRGAQSQQRPPAPPIPDQPRIDRLGTQATKSAGLCLPLAIALLLGVQLEWIGGAWFLAAEHLAALGWIMLMICGVAYHVLPRFSGRGVRGVRWAQAQIRAHMLALVLIVLSLGFGWPTLFAAGGVVMAGALALFAWTIWPTLRVIAPRSGLVTLTIKERPR